jgi:hypothetical protein
MKKLLLLSALFIFACSSEDSSVTNDNSNPPLKQLLSFEMIENTGNIIIEGTSCYFTYENNKIITSEEHSYPNLGNIVTKTYDYFDNQIIITNWDLQGGIDVFPIENGLFSSYENVIVEFENNKLIKYGRFDLTWEGNNISLIEEDGFPITLEYSTIENKTDFFSFPFLWEGHLGINNNYIPWVVSGAMGISPINLPSKLIISEQRKYEYQYTFDDDGYPIYITETQTDSYGQPIVNVVTYKLTYTN